MVQDVAEGFFEGLSGVLGDDFPGIVRSKVPGFFPGKVQGFAHNLGCIVKGAGTRYGYIAQSIVVGGVVLEGAVAPAVPVAVVSVVQRNAVEVEEFVGTGAGSGGKAGLGRNGISFSKGLFQVELPVDRGPHLARKPGDYAPLAKLKLGLVTGFVGGQHGGPGGGLGAVELGVGVEVHAAGGPAYGAVGIDMVRVEHDGHLAAHSVTGRHAAQAPSHGNAELLQGAAVAAGQGIGSFRVNQFIMRSFHAVPAQACGVVSGQKKLGLCREGAGQKEQRDESLLVHTTQI